MVDGQIRTFGVSNLDVIDAFLTVPRELFVEPGQAGLAYSDAVLTLAGEPRRQLLTPMILARMIQAAEPRAGERALVVASGLGYGAALLARLGMRVRAIEARDARVSAARGAWAACGVEARAQAGAAIHGDPEGGPYDLILIEGGFVAGVDALAGQLADGGRLVAVRLPREGGLGQMVCIQSSGGHLGARPILEARAALVEGFEEAPAFVF